MENSPLGPDVSGLIHTLFYSVHMLGREKVNAPLAHYWCERCWFYALGDDTGMPGETEERILIIKCGVIFMEE